MKIHHWFPHLMSCSECHLYWLVALSWIWKNISFQKDCAHNTSYKLSFLQDLHSYSYRMSTWFGKNFKRLFILLFWGLYSICQTASWDHSKEKKSDRILILTESSLVVVGQIFSDDIPGLKCGLRDYSIHSSNERSCLREKQYFQLHFGFTTHL